MTAESGKSIRPFLGYERLVNELGYPAYAKKLEAEAMGSNPDGFITERAKLFLNIERRSKRRNCIVRTLVEFPFGRTNGK